MKIFLDVDFDQNAKILGKVVCIFRIRIKKVPVSPKYLFFFLLKWVRIKQRIIDDALNNII